MIKRRFTFQLVRAAQRGIEWCLTFEEWLDVWQRSGHSHERGRGRGRYVMARRGDIGPYSVGNVEIILYEQNSRDARTNNPEAARLSGIRRTGSGRGWTFVKKCPARPYQVAVCDKFIGCFATQREAEEAYAIAAKNHRLRAEGLKGIDGGVSGNVGASEGLRGSGRS